MYFTRVIKYSPAADKMAEELEKVINETCQQENVDFITFSITNTAKAIAVFKKEG